MAKQDIYLGVEGNDGTGDSIREAFRKANENFTELPTEHLKFFLLPVLLGETRLESTMSSQRRVKNTILPWVPVRSHESF